MDENEEQVQQEETAVEETVPDEPVRAEPDPRDVELAQLRAQFTVLAQHLQTTQQPPPLQKSVEPDFSDAEEYGSTPEAERRRFSKTMAYLAPIIEAAKPKSLSFREARDEVIERLGVEKSHEVIGVFVEQLDELSTRGELPGGLTEANLPKLTRAVRRALPKQTAPAPTPSRTAGTGGASLPPGRSAAKPEPKYETLVETMRKDRRKRGLSYY